MRETLAFIAIVFESVFLGMTLHAKGFSIPESFIFGLAWFSLRSQVSELVDRAREAKR